MTDQIHDSIIYNGEIYGIDCISGPERIFTPEKYGFKPKASCTACWRGFVCTYEILQDFLYLSQLSIYDEMDNYPLLNGVAISEESLWGSVYKNIRMPLTFSGHITIGTDFRWSQGIGSYQKLYTLLFVEGQFIKSVSGKPSQIKFPYLN